MAATRAAVRASIRIIFLFPFRPQCQAVLSRANNRLSWSLRCCRLLSPIADNAPANTVHVKVLPRLLATFAAILLIAPTGAAVARATECPNIVLIVGDDQAWTDYGFMGHEHIQTPHLDRLASEGLLFKRGYVPTSLCRPSLATMITGLYPHQHKITANDPPTAEGAGRRAGTRPRLPEAAAGDDRGTSKQSPTLPRLLENEGLHQLPGGQVVGGTHAAAAGFTQGMTHGDPAKGGRHGDEGLKIGREGMQPVFDFLDEGEEGRQAVLRLVRADDAARAAQPAASGCWQQVQATRRQSTTSRSTGRCASGSTRPCGELLGLARRGRSWPRTRWSSILPTTAGFRTPTANSLRPASRSGRPTTAGCARRSWSAGPAGSPRM